MFKNTKDKAIGALRKVNEGLNKKGFGVTKVDKIVAPNTTEKFNRVGFGKLGKVDVPRGELTYKKPKQMEAMKRKLGVPLQAKKAKKYVPSDGIGVGP